jgi:crotonobetainyl-CoA:carnitine CoA-transferase CaiB-like acyl-CoA transferase
VTGPLDGLRVVDLTQVLSGPFCTMVLADLGADVVKVEPPAGDVARAWGPHPDAPDGADGARPPDGYGGYFASVNRNKRGVVLDLKTEAGRAGLHRLLDDADAVVENYRVGVMERLGLGYEALHERHPRLVCVCVRGFGDPRTGLSPYAGWPAFDIVAQAMGGLMGITGPDAGHPTKVGPGVGDIFPGVLAAVGLLAAVRHAECTGEGQLVDVAMYDAVLSLCERVVYQQSITGVAPGPQGNTHPLLCPYGVVASADGFVTVAAPSDHHWRLLAELIGRPELGTDERYATNADRLSRAGEVYRLVEGWSRALPTTDVVRVLGGRIPCGPVASAADILDDPHARARQMLVDLPHPGGSTVTVAGAPIKFTATPTAPFRPAPLLGEHTDEVLRAAVVATGRARPAAEED